LEDRDVSGAPIPAAEDPQVTCSLSFSPLRLRSTRSGGRRSQAPGSTAFPPQRPNRARFETETTSTADETATLAARRSSRSHIGLERRGPRPLASSMFSMPRSSRIEDRPNRRKRPHPGPVFTPICR
jgi:hypothetical protein